MRIHLCIPAYQNMVHATLISASLNLLKEVAKHGDEFGVSFVSTSLISYNRNFLMEEAKDADYILMWDADIQVLKQSFIYDLIETMKKEKAALLGLVVRMKSSNTRPIYCCGYKKKDKYEKISALPEKPIEIDFIGAGITLLDNKWIRKNIKEPFYEIKDLKGPTMIPEDWMLCDKIKSNGGRIIADPTVGTIHYGQYGWPA